MYQYMPAYTDIAHMWGRNGFFMRI